MFCRAKIGLLALSLLLVLSLLVLLSVPPALMAAPQGRRGFRGHGFRGGHAVRQGHVGGGFRFGRVGRGATHFRGFGHIRHRGFGFGFQTRHFRSPLRIRSFHRRSFRGPRIYGYPYGYAYPYGSYYGYGYGLGSYGLGGVAAVGVPVIGGYASGAPPPTVIIIQEGPQRPSVHMPAPQAPYEQRGASRPPPERPERPDRREQEVGRRYQTRPPPVPPEPVQPQALLVFKGRSVYSVAEYWKTGDQLCFLNSYGVGKCVPVDQLDLAFTKELNQGRNLKFELKGTQ